MGTLSLTYFEIIFLFLSAIVVGVVIHFFITSRRNLKNEMKEVKRNGSKSGMNEWKLKYLNDIEVKDRDLEDVKQKFLESDETNKIYLMEIEELRRQNKKFAIEINTPRPVKPAVEGKTDYFEQLKQAQVSLLEHNQKISQLLEQVDVIKESEEKNVEIQRSNEELNNQIRELRNMLGEKEKEINQIKQKENLTKEMNSMLDNAYNDFNLLQTKIQKLESQLTSSKMVNIEYEDLQESYYKISHDFEESKQRLNHYMQENQNLQIQLAKTEDKLSEANLQRQQLQKKVAYLEELTDDLQQMNEANKKLQGQLKRIGELESRLNMVSEERDQLREKQSDDL